MSLTLTIPTLKQVTDAIFLIVAYYATLVAPQFDWVVFGVCYYFGACVALRSWWRMKPKHTGWSYLGFDWHAWCVLTFIACLAWVLTPALGLTSFLVTTGNPRGNRD